MTPDPAPDLSAGVLGDDDLRRMLVEDTAAFVRDFHRWVDARAENGLTLPSLRVLERLHCQGPAMMRTLADELGLSPRNMTALVDGLEGSALVARRPHPSDRRAVVVELTASGTDASDAVLGPRIAAMGELFDVLDEGERQQFSALIGRLRAAMAEAPVASAE
jgi:DNA-binding MarR family transcriptional regulator